jgi:exodeoxyribonuclease VII small subunit
VTKKNDTPLDKMKLEDAVQRLETIVSELESGQVDLEKSITLFEEGKKVGSVALKKLQNLERRIEVVIQDEENGLETEEFPDTSGS